MAKILTPLFVAFVVLSFAVVPAKAGDRIVGEKCSAFYPCSKGLTCSPFAGFKCIPNTTAGKQEWLGQGCLDMYSDALKKDAEKRGMVTTLGTSTGFTAGLATRIIELGVAYGLEKDQFACYYTECSGGEADVNIGAGFVAGFYGRNWDQLAGTSNVLFQGASFFVIEGGAVTSEVFASPWNYIGQTIFVGAGVGLNPISFGAYQCKTEMVDVTELKKKSVIKTTLQSHPPIDHWGAELTTPECRISYEPQSMEFRMRPFFLDGEVMAVDHITGTYGGRLAVVATTRSSGTFFATSEDDGATWVKSTSQSNVKSVDAVTLRQNGKDVHLLYALTRGSANNWLLEYSKDWGKTWTNQRIEATHADKESVDAAQIVVSVNLGGQFVKNQLVIVNDELRVYNPNAQNWFSKPNVKPGGVAAYSANAWIHDSQSGDLLFAKDPYKEIPRTVSWKGCPSTLARSWFSSGPNELFAVTPKGDLYSAAFRDFTWRKIDTGQAPFGGFAKVVYTEAGVWLIDVFGQLYRYGSDERLAEFKPDQGIPSDIGQIAQPSLANAVSGFISGTSFAGLTSDYIASMPGLKVCASSETAKTFAMVMGERGADIDIMTVQDMADAYLKTYAWWLGTGGLGDDQKTKRFDRIKRFYSRNEPSPRCEIMLTEGTLDSDSPWNDSRELGNKLYDLKLEFGNDWVAHQLYSPQTGLAASTP